MKRIKPIIQRDIKDCGISCMQWIIKYYDGYVSLEKLREDTFTDFDGTSLYHIVECFKKWGFDSCGVLEKNIESNKLKFPLIAHLSLDNGLKHFVVVKMINNDTLYIMDPGIGDRKMSLEEFSKVFTGYIVMATPREKIIKMDKELSMYELFLKILIKEKFLIFKIIITSFIWTFLVIISSYYLKIGSNLISEDKNYLKFIVICFGFLTVLKLFTTYIKEYYQNHLNNLIDVNIYPEFLRHLFFLPLKNIKSRSIGDVITRINDLTNIKSMFNDVFVTIFIDSILLLGTMVMLFLIKKELTIILLIFIFFYILIGILSSKLIYKKAFKNICYQTDFNSLAVENIEMFESIKNLNITKYILDKFENTLSNLLLNNFEFSAMLNIINLLKDSLLEIALFIINSYGLFKVCNGSFSIIDLFTFNIVAPYLIDSVKNIINLLPKFEYFKASFAKISEFMAIKEENFQGRSNDIKGNIIFENIKYSYNNYNYILNNLNFKIESGTHVFFNGPSGVGKSTVCKLLYKEYTPNSGNIYIGNQNLKDISLNTIRENILYISQEENLFTGTLRENILVGRNIQEEKFIEICNVCEINRIVEKRDLRYETLIEPSSKNISGGEKERIILARGLLKNANIIILDEALAEVDKNCEKRIIENIRKYFSDKTIIYISHKNHADSFEFKINIGENNEIF